MWTKKKRALYIIYTLIAKNLPQSNHSYFSKRIRCFLGKCVVEKCGRRVNFEKGAIFTPYLTIGENSGIGINCELYGPIHIGDNVMMGPEVVIYTRNHCHVISDQFTFMEQGYENYKPVIIGNNVWIGRRVMVMPGVQIGNNVVLAAGTVVAKNVPDNTIVGGNPARILKNRSNKQG